MLAVLYGKFEGIGSGSSDLGPAPVRLLLSKATSFGTVRFFCAVNETDQYVFEQVGWFLPSSKPAIVALN